MDSASASCPDTSAIACRRCGDRTHCEWQMANGERRNVNGDRLPALTLSKLRTVRNRLLRGAARICLLSGQSGCLVSRMNFAGMWAESGSDPRERLKAGRGEKAVLGEYLDRYRMTARASRRSVAARRSARVECHSSPGSARPFRPLPRSSGTTGRPAADHQRAVRGDQGPDCRSGEAGLRAMSVLPAMLGVCRWALAYSVEGQEQRLYLLEEAARQPEPLRCPPRKTRLHGIPPMRSSGPRPGSPVEGDRQCLSRHHHKRSLRRWPNQPTGSTSGTSPRTPSGLPRTRKDSSSWRGPAACIGRDAGVCSPRRPESGPVILAGGAWVSFGTAPLDHALTVIGECADRCARCKPGSNPEGVSMMAEYLRRLRGLPPSA